jgi:DNA-binding transcriptional ArsR family regulator
MARPASTKTTGQTADETRPALRKKASEKRIRAMSHPLRAVAFRLLIERGEMSPAEISRETGANLSDVSYHVRQLVELDCAEMVRTRPVRGAVEHFYVATDRHLIDTEEWEELEPLVAEDLVCEFMQKILDDFVASRKAGIVGSDKNFHITRTPVNLDREGMTEALDAFERCRLEIADIEARSAARRSDSGEATVPTSSSLALFEMPPR